MQFREVNVPKGTQCKWRRLDLHPGPSDSKSLALSQPPTAPDMEGDLRVVLLLVFPHWIHFCNLLQVQDLWVTCYPLLRPWESSLWFENTSHANIAHIQSSVRTQKQQLKKKTNSEKGRLGNTAPGSLVHIIKHTQLDRKSQDSGLGVRVSSSSANLSTTVLLSGKTFLGPCLPKSVVKPTRNVILFHCPPNPHTDDD